ncbi:MAG: GYDIA family GHMP kinase [Candidatus Limimorpha sp.]
MKTYRANGKLLLTGEYLVLQGSKALALPLRVGQTMEADILPIRNGIIHWDAMTTKGLWFTAMLDKHDFSVRCSDDIAKAETLSGIFKVLKSLNPNILCEDNDYAFSTRLEADSQWGLGSSSTLISLLSQWADVNPYQVLKETFGGSGYDIACATALKPIIYQIADNTTRVEETNFSPSFIDNLYFVYQGNKQSSGKEVKNFKDRAKEIDFTKEIQEISKITETLATGTTFVDFCSLLERHEEIISRCIDRRPLKINFPDFHGTIKSLGAWGGDFFLAATEMPYQEVLNYFNKKRFDVIFRYKDIIIK